MIKHLFDLLLAFILLAPVCCISFIIIIAIKLTSNAPVLYWSKRVGKNNIVFNMPKFRSMQLNTPEIATHLLTNPHEKYTPIGLFLRRSSLDELPQLWSIIKGDMSFVGPRPALFNQYDLIALRTQYQIAYLIPGLTGWAQINGRDSLSLIKKVALDKEYHKKRCFSLDLYILAQTLLNIFHKKNIQH